MKLKVKKLVHGIEKKEVETQWLYDTTEKFCKGVQFIMCFIKIFRY